VLELVVVATTTPDFGALSLLLPVACTVATLALSGAMLAAIGAGVVGTARAAATGIVIVEASGGRTAASLAADKGTGAGFTGF
jgi:hypothetical protein